MTRSNSSMRYRLLKGWALHGRKVQHLTRRIEDVITVWTGAVLDGLLRDDEKEALSIDLYDASFRPDNDHDGLYDWEQQWFERRLPAPPASILIGAAGAGREASALKKLGYRVHAFEPAGSAFRLCLTTIGSEFVDQASYEDLVATVLRGETTRLRLASEATFDAVLLGWGSFGHVLQRDDRSELLRACDRIAPDGPILLSTFEPSSAASTHGTYYLPWGGFLVRPTAEEFDQHAKALNRRLVVSLQSPNPYATLIPAGA